MRTTNITRSIPAGPPKVAVKRSIYRASQLLVSSMLALFAGAACASVTDADAWSALQIQSSALSIYPKCDQPYIAQQDTQLSGTLARADFIAAAVQGKLMSANVSACAMQARNSLPQWADQAGRMLAMGVIAATLVPGGMTTPEIASSGDRATLLLQYAAEHGSSTAVEVIDLLLRSNYRTFNHAFH